MGTRRRSPTSATRPSSGLTPTSWPRWRSSPTSRRRWRLCATPSSPSCTSRLEVHQVACQTWEVCQVLVVLLLLEDLDPDPPSRRSTKLSTSSPTATTTNQIINSSQYYPEYV